MSQPPEGTDPESARSKFVVLDHSLESGGKLLTEKRRGQVIRLDDGRIKVVADIERSIDDDKVVFKMEGFAGEALRVTILPRLKNRRRNEFLNEWRFRWNPNITERAHGTEAIDIVARLDPTMH